MENCLGSWSKGWQSNGGVWDHSKTKRGDRILIILTSHIKDWVCLPDFIVWPQYESGGSPQIKTEGSLSLVSKRHNLTMSRTERFSGWKAEMTQLLG